MNEQGGGTNIGSVEVSVVADLAKALEQIAVLEGKLEALKKPVTVSVQVEETQAGGRRRRAGTAAPVEAPPPSATMAAQSGGVLKIALDAESGLAAKIRMAAHKAFAEAFEVTLRIRNLEQIRQELGSVQAASNSPSGAPSQQSGGLRPQQEQELYRTWIAQYRTTKEMLNVWRGNPEFRGAVGTVQQEMQTSPGKFGGANVEGDVENNGTVVAQKIVRALVPAMEHLNLSDVSPYLTRIGNARMVIPEHREALVRTVAPHLDATDETVQMAVARLVPTLPLSRGTEDNPGYKAFFDKEAVQTAPAPTPSTAPTPQPERAAPAETADRAAVARAKEAVARQEEAQKKITEAFTRAVSAEPIDLAGITGFASPAHHSPRPGMENALPAYKRAARQRNEPARTSSGETAFPRDYQPGDREVVTDEELTARREQARANTPPFEVRKPEDLMADLGRLGPAWAAFEPTHNTTAEARMDALGTARHSGGSQAETTSRSDNPDALYSVGGVEIPGLGAVNVGGLLRAISAGVGGSAMRFGEVVQGKNRGEIRRLTPTPGASQDDFEDLLSNAGTKTPITTASGERVRRIGARDLFRRILIEQFGQDKKAGEKVDELLDNPDNPIGMALRLASMRGSAPLNATRGVSQMASSPERDARLALRYKNVQEQISRLEPELERRQSAKRIGPKRQKAIYDLQAQLEPLYHERKELYDAGADTDLYLDPAQRHLANMDELSRRQEENPDLTYGDMMAERREATKAIEKARGEQSRSNIEQGVGLSEREKLERRLPSLQNEATVARIESGEMPDIFGAVKAASQRFHSGDFEYQPTENGPESNYGAMRRLVADELHERFGLGMAKRNKRFVVTPEEGVPLGRDDSKTINEMLSAALAAEFGDADVKNMYAERSLTARTAGRGGYSTKGVTRMGSGGEFSRIQRGNAVTRQGPAGENGFVMLANPDNPGTGPGHIATGSGFSLPVVKTRDQGGQLATFHEGRGTPLSAAEEQAAFAKAGGVGPGNGMSPYDTETQPEIPVGPRFAAGNAALRQREARRSPVESVPVTGAPMAGGPNVPSGPAGPEAPGGAHPEGDGGGMVYRVFVTNWPAGGEAYGKSPGEPGGPRDALTAHRMRSYRMGPATTRGFILPRVGDLEPEGGDIRARHREAEAVRRRFRIKNKPIEDAVRRAQGPTISGPMGEDAPGFVMYGTASSGNDMRARHQEAEAVRRRRRQATAEQERQERARKREERELNRTFQTIPGLGVLGSGRFMPYMREQSDRAIAANARLQRQQGLMQSRSFGTTFVALAENLVGGRQGYYERVRTANEAARRFNALDARRQSLGNEQIELLGARRYLAGEMRTARSEGNAPKLEALTKKFNELGTELTRNRENLKSTGPLYEKFAKDMDEASARVVSMGSVAQNLMGGAMGAVMGLVAMQGVSALAQSAIQAAADAFGPGIEHAFGDPNVTATITKQLSQSFQQASGNIASVGATLGQQGVSAGAYSMISAQLEQRISTTAGNQNLAALGGYQRAAANIARGNAGLGGYDAGLYQTTGGFWGTPIGGQASTAEIINGQISGLNGQKDTLSPGEKMAIAQGYSLPKDSGVVAQAALNLKAFNDQALKAGSGLKLVADASGKYADQTEAAAREAERGGNSDLAKTIRTNHLVVENANGTPAQNQNPLSDYLRAVNLGSQTPDVSLLTGMQTVPLQNRMYSQYLQTQNALNYEIPGQWAMQQAMSPLGNLGGPLAALGSPLAGTASVLSAGVAMQTVGAAYQGQQFIDKNAPEYAQQYTQALGQAAMYGQQITQLQLGAQTQQAAYQAAQWNNELRLANRSYSDALGMAGKITAAGKDNLGVLERQNFLLGVQLQDIGFLLQQKQINFKLATAGFTAPGDTPEERAARIEQAKLEAQYAQKQLDIQRQMAQVGRKQFGVSASRAVTDTSRQVALLEQGINVQKYTAGVEAVAKALSAMQQQEAAKAQKIFSLASERAGTLITTVESLASAAQQSMVKVGDSVITWYNKTLNQMIAALPYNNGTSGSGSWEPAPAGKASWAHASGMLGMTTGITSLGIAGEAGGEAVAILRNPRPLNGTPMAMGGGISMPIIITGNTVRDDGDIDAIVRKVVQAMNGRAALMGYRRPV